MSDTYTDNAGRLLSELHMFRKPVFVPAIPLAATIAIALGIASFDVRPVASQQPGRERVLYASVVDKNGEPVNGLGPDDFIVREDNARREVLRVSRASDPLAIAVLVDDSAAAEDDIKNIRDGLTKFITQMRADSDIALIGLGDRPTILQDYTRNAELLNSAVGRLFARPGSGMQFLEAVVDVSRGLRKREEPRAVMIPILTDGAEFSNLHYNQVLESLDDSGAAMHAVMIGRFARMGSDELRNRASVLDIGPRQSGGQQITVLTSMAVTSSLEKLGRELSNQYKVVYGRPESLVPPERVTVGVAHQGLTARGTPERRKPGV
jgi:Ca-activated chloride channel homolog